MICWSCERAAGAEPLCGNCGAIQPPIATLDHFSVLGLPRRYDADLEMAEERFRTLSRQFHPDRFARAEARARRASLQRSVQLNEAWRTIADAVRRAEYLLGLYGHPIGVDEGGAAPRGAPREGAQAVAERLSVPTALLGEILELREALGDARVAGDEETISRMAVDTRARIDAGMKRVAESFARFEDQGAGGRLPSDASHLARAAAELIAIRYFRRFLDEVAVHEEDRAAHISAAGAAGAAAGKARAAADAGARSGPIGG